MNVALLTARRYLFARKKHNVINVISAVSAVGMAIGTAALILILSVYNGFDVLVKDNIGDLSPDLLMVAPDGAALFVPDSAVVDRLWCDKRTTGVRYILEDKVFLTYGDKQGLALARGMESDSGEEDGRLAAHVHEGSFTLMRGDTPGAVIGSTLARKLGIHPRFVDPLVLYYPDRRGRISPSNPAASARSAKVSPTGLVSITADTDAELVIVPLHVLQELTGCGPDEISGVEIMLSDPSPGNLRRFKRDYAGACTLKDRYEQHPTLFKMMRYEKAAVFLVLFFVVLIVALNIYGSLTMLMMEKEDDMATLRAMGATGRMCRRIFLYEGLLISLAGICTGLLAGVLLALLQQNFGIVSMPGNYIIQAYPVVLKTSDVLVAAVSTACIGLGISALSARSQAV